MIIITIIFNMSNKFWIYLLLIISIVSLSHAKLLFVHETFRHGARSSDIGIETEEDFPNGKGMLTASGMRQHFLLGSYIRDRYINKTQFMSPTYEVSELYIQSTQVPRTVQSAQCQLMGMYPLGTSEKLQEKQVKSAIPNIKVDNLEKIQKELGLNPVVDGYQPIPVHNFDVNTEDDVLGYANCPILFKDYEEKVMNETYWKKFDDFYGPLIYDKISEIFGVPKEQMKFMLAVMLADVLYAEKFQGVKPRYNFTESEWEILKSFQVTMLLNSLSEKSIKIIASRYTLPIVEMMKKKLGKSYNVTATNPYGDSKMILFSSHDLQLSFLLKTLAPTNLDLKFVEFASNLFYELAKDDSFMCSVFNYDSCYTVRAIYNGKTLSLPGCSSDICTFSEFENYINSRLYSYEQLSIEWNSPVPPGFVPDPVKISPQKILEYYLK